MNTQLIIYPSNHLVSGYTITIDSPVLLNYAISDVRDLNVKKSSYTKQFEIAGSVDVNRMFAHIFEFGIESSFNPNKKILCQIVQESQTQLTGYLQLKSIRNDLQNQLVYYSVIVYSASDNLLRNLSGVQLQDLDLSSYNHIYTASTIVNSWANTSNNGGIVYPLIDFGKNYTFDFINDPLHFVNYLDMRPAIYLRNLVDAIFDKAGYTYTSEFFGSEMYRSIVIPLNSNFNLPKDFVEERKSKAVCDADVICPTSGSQSLFLTPVFADDNLLGYNTSGNYNNATGFYTFDTAMEASIKIKLSLYFSTSNSAGCSAKVYVQKTEASTGIITNIWESSYLQGNNFGNLDFEFETQPFIFQPGDTFRLIVERFGLLQLVDIKVGSYFAVNPTTQIVYGAYIDVASILPENYNAIEFLSDVFKTFNLYFEEDKNNHQNIIIEPRNEFYLNSEIVDWEFDTSKQINQIVLPELQAKNILLSWTADGDYFNKYYTDKKNKIYGQNTITIDNDFLKEDSVLAIQPKFAPTPLSKVSGSGMIISKIFKANDAGIAEPFQSKLRLLFYKLVPGPIWYHGIGYPATYPSLLTPYAGHLDNPFLHSFDLNWGIPEEVYFSVSGTNGFNQFTYLNNNLYTEFWKNTIEEVADSNSRLIQCYVNLQPKDIVNLSFRNSIRINGIVYKLNKIIDYDPASASSTKVELIKSSNNIPTISAQDYSIAVEDNDTFSARINLGRNNTIQSPFNSVVGDNNLIGSNSEGNTITGDYNNILNNSRNFIVSGYKNSGTSQMGAIIGGSGNSLSYENINSNIIGAVDSAINSHGNTHSAIFGGRFNIIGQNSIGNFISGGLNNAIEKDNVYSSIFNSVNSTINSNRSYSTILNSKNCIVDGTNISIFNSYFTNVNNRNNTAINAQYSLINGSNSVIMGGAYNRVENIYSANATISGSKYSIVNGSYSSIISGYRNKLESSYSVIIGGRNYTAITADDSVYVPQLTVWMLAEGGDRMVTANSEGKLFYSDIPVGGSGGTIYNIVNTGGTHGIYAIKNGNTFVLKSLSGGNSNILIASSTTENVITLNNNVNINSLTASTITATTIDVDYYYSGGTPLDFTFKEKIWCGSTGTQSVVRNNYTNNLAVGNFSIIGGADSYSSGNFSSIAGGSGHTLTGNYSFIGGGQNNKAYGHNSILGGGSFNTLSGNSATLIGGFGNNAYRNFSVVIGGFGNYNTGVMSSIVGGNFNSAITSYTTVIGGSTNLASGVWAHVNGGYRNHVSGNYSSIINGLNNYNTGKFSTILSGRDNKLTGTGSTIAGGNSFTGNSDNMLYTPNATIYDVQSGGTYMATFDNDGKLFYQDIPTGGSGGTSTYTASNIGGQTPIYSAITATNFGFRTLSAGTITEINNNTTTGVLTIRNTLLSGGSGSNSGLQQNGSNNASGQFAWSIGKQNTVSSSYSFAFGSGNTVSGGGGFGFAIGQSNYSRNGGVVLGRSNNYAKNYSLIAGKNNYSNYFSFVTGNYNTSTISRYSSIIGGEFNTISAGRCNAIIGGISNTLSTGYALILGGKSNSNAGIDAVMLGGTGNTIGSNANRSAIIGGVNNLINGGVNNTVILGGNNITAATNSMVYVPNLTINNITNGGVEMVTISSTGQLFKQAIGSVSSITTTIITVSGSGQFDTLSANTIYSGASNIGNLFARKPEVKIKTSNQSHSGSSTIEVTDLIFNVEAGKQYLFECNLLLSGGTGGMRTGVSGNTAPELNLILQGNTGAITGLQTTAHRANGLNNGQTIATSSAFISTESIKGYINNTGSTGTFSIIFQAISAGNYMTVLAGSSGRLDPI